MNPGSRVPPAPSTTTAPAGGVTSPTGPTSRTTPPAATTVRPGTAGPPPPSTTATPTTASAGAVAEPGIPRSYTGTILAMNHHPGAPLVLHGPPDGSARLRLGRRVTMYVCGITPYDAAHVGHAFTYVA